MSHSNVYVFIVTVIILQSVCCADKNARKEASKQEILPPCQACKLLASSFKKGMEKTGDKHFGGGDTAYEIAKLGQYPKSGIRLVEIQDHMCSDVVRGQSQCYTLADEWEQIIEDWWFSSSTEVEPRDIFKWLCIEKMEYCCPEYHYGPECKPCNGFPDVVCSNNGRCRGSGTRKGNGECTCNEGYTGPACNQCSTLYFEAYRDDQKLLCTKCHKACRDSCTAAGPKGCKYCNSGWIEDPDRGCIDINECATLDPCRKSQFCVNNEGSFTCLACDASCTGCFGDGPDMCTECAQGYTLQDGLCEKEQERNLEWTRYLTYLGLCIATFIIFQKNTLVASLVGLSVAIYVSVSEYMLSRLSSQGGFNPFQRDN